MDYLTVVEFSVEDPYGRAVALLDLRSGFVKAKAKWMVLRGLIILAFITSNILRKEGYKGFIATSKVLKMNASTEKVSGVELNGNVVSVDARIAEKIRSSSGDCGGYGCVSQCENAVKSAALMNK